MNKSISIILAFLMIPILLCADGVQPAGSGTEADPWHIATLDNLLWVSTNDTSWGDHFIQTVDIDASDTQNWNGGEGWSPIGNETNQFTGEYNGQEYMISGLFANRPTDYDQGLFGSVNEAHILGCILVNADITGNRGVSCLVGNAFSTVIEYCSTSGYATGSWGVGGIVGEGWAGNNVSQCVNSSSISGSYIDIGGICGYFSGSTMSECLNTGSVQGGSRVGGIVGSGNSASVDDCYSTGAISGDDQVGGFIGRTHSVSSATSFSTGTVTGNSSTGGLVGRIYTGGASVNCFWDTETSGQTTSAGGTGKTTAEMMDIATYTDLSTVGLDAPWDFLGDPNDDTGNEDIWHIDGATNGGYPFLSWQEPAMNLLAEGDVSGTWYLSDSPVHVIDDITIQNSETLIIEPGVEVVFDGHYKFVVQGTLLALGTASDSIRFTVSDTTGFSDNNHTGWKGIRFEYNPTTNDSSKFAHCIFEYGKATDYNNDNNVSDDRGGAVYLLGSSEVTFSNCTFQYNYAHRSGGAISVLFGASLNLTNCLIHHNRCDGWGGGIRFHDAYHRIENCIISNNAGSSGGGMQGDCYENGYSGEIINSIFCNNTAYEGGGIEFYAFSPKIVNCDIVANYVSGNGGGFECYANSSPNFTNCLITLNENPSGSNQCHIRINDNSHPKFYYCNIEGGTSSFSGDGYPGECDENLDVNPVFVNPAGGSGPAYDGVEADWSLDSSSPCINQGTPDTSNLPVLSIDLAGNPRIFDSRIDIGAYENQQSNSFFEQDSLALISIYENLDGDNWTYNDSWLTEAPLRDWYGVTIWNHRVTGLDLTNNQLSGAIPTDFALLTNLTQLWLADNNLTGTIPAELGQLTNLSELWIGGNQLTGTIPEELGDLPELSYLSLSNNQLTGALPASFASMEEMDGLYLDGNDISDIPALTNMPSLRYLWVHDNQLTFEDIEPNLDVPSNFFLYAPQDSVLTAQHLTLRHGESCTLRATVGGEHNVYQWYKDDSPFAADSVIALDNLVDSDSGVYTCEVTNTLATELTLYRRPITLEIRPNNPPEIALPDSLHMLQNETTVIDFSPYVSDEDGDELALTVVGNVNIGVEVNGLQVSFICSYDWIGQEELTFIVDDGVIERRFQASTRSRSERQPDTHDRTTASDDCWINVFTPLEFDFYTDSELNNNVVAGDEELALTFSAVSYANPITSWAWDFDNDGNVDSEEENPVWTYMDEGHQTVSVTVSDGVHVNWLTKEDFVLVHPGQTVPGGDVETDIVWTEAGGPYNITGELLLREDVTLTIEENTQVNLLMDSALTVNGSLVATNADFTAYGPDGWGGLVFNPASDGNVIDGLSVEGASIAITINESSPSLHNIAVAGSPHPDGRPATSAILINGNASPDLRNIHISGYEVGIRGVNNGDIFAAMQFSNIHLNRLHESPALEDTGLQFEGKFDIEIDSLLIEGYPNGGTFDDPAATGLPRIRLTNTRVRHTESSAREPHTGLAFINIAEIELESDSLGNFQKGIVIDNNGLPSPGQISIRSLAIAHERYAQAEYGFYLTGPSEGHITDGDFKNYRNAVFITGNNQFVVSNTDFYNCGTCMTLDNNTDICVSETCIATRDDQFAGDTETPAMDVISGSENVFANWTLFNYDCAIRTTVNMTNVYQCIFWGDQPMTNPVEIVSGSGPDITYCDIDWEDGVWPGEGNINADPLFVTQDSTDFYLDVYSPCIDAGHPENQPDPDGSIPDMGAVWFNQDSMPLYVDFYWDVDSGLAPLTVQFTDHATFNAIDWQWDFDGDGEIDATEPSPQWTYEIAGVYDVSLAVSDGERDTTLTMENLIEVCNAAPHIVQPFADLTLEEDFTSFYLLLSAYIADDNGDALSYSADFNDEDISLEITGDTLWIQCIPDWSGQTLVTITADDGRVTGRTRKQNARRQTSLRDQVSDDFQITVDAVNDAPYLFAQLPDTTGVQDFGNPIEYVLTEFFADVDNDVLLFSVEYQPNEINAQVNGSSLILTSVEGWFGTTQIIVTANDQEPVSRKTGMMNRCDPITRATCRDTFLVALDEVSIDSGEIPSWPTRLYPVYPNPVNGETCISFSLNEPSNVDVAIYNVKGQRVTVLASERFGKGMHRLMWNCRDQHDQPVATGIYLVHMRSRESVEMKKIMYIK